MKDWGFSVTRRRLGRRRAWRPSAWFWFAAVAGLLLIAGATRGWPQNSDWSSSSSSDDLRTWEKLSDEFRTALSGQSTLLWQALTELETSKANSTRLTYLLEQSLTANESLNVYNSQITARMQDRDEDLATAYGDINRLERGRARLVLTVVIMGAVLVIIVVLIAAGILIFQIGRR